MNRRAIVIVAAMVILLAGRWAAADAYYKVTSEQLKLADKPKPSTQPIGWRMSLRSLPWVVLDGPGEIYISGPNEITSSFDSMVLLAKLPGVGVLSGRLIWPADDGKSVSVHRFKVDLEPLAKAPAEFKTAKSAHYTRLLYSGAEGAGWFRYQARMAGDATNLDNRRFDRMGRGFDPLEETFDVFSGGRAISENLQLDRALPTTRSENPTIQLADVKGIETKEMDFAPLIKDARPQLDPLASLIPADQHAIFFPSFAALTAASDETNLHFTSAAKLAGATTMEPRVRQRYEQQLCLPLTTLGRLLGPTLIGSVAITGSDPYLLVGTDIAVLFEARDPATLLTAVRTQGQLSTARRVDVKRSTGKVGNVEYAANLSADRSISSYTAAIGKMVVVTNTLAQLERIAAVKPETSLAVAPEYIFFRTRYVHTDKEETALIVLTDATIRRWCSPRWRIGDSRRTLAAAGMADLQAKAIDQNLKPGPVAGDFPIPDGGELALGSRGITSSIYNTLEFMTPIIELEMEKITAAESGNYARWRDGYQRNWTAFFDPLAIRLSLTEQKIAADLTIMPLIEQTRYRWLIDLTEGAKLTAGGGDPHDAIFQIAVALNSKSDEFKQYGNTIKTFTGNLRIDPLAWVGESASIYADDDLFWEELAKAPKKEEFMEKNLGRLPVGLYVQNGDSFKLAAFMAMVRGFVDQSSPGLLAWETLNHNDQPYVKVGPTPKARAEQRGIPDIAIYYAATPKALIVTPSEALLKRAIDRQADGNKQQNQKPWLGENGALQVTRKIVDIWLTAMNDEITGRMHQNAWANIAILNEWKRLYPNENPVDAHERLWHIRLSDPLGGTYEWDEEHATMQSINFGHPGHPKAAALLAEHPLLKRLLSLNAGLTFENQGLRTRVEVERSK